MELLEQIEQDLRQALKGGEELKKEVLRMVKADLMMEKAKTGKDISSETALEVVTRAAKRRKEAAAEFTKALREDLAAKELSELTIIEAYLPKQLSAEECAVYISEKIKSFGEVTQKDFGRVMSEIMKELKGKVDGSIVKKIITEKLSGN